MEAKRWRYPLLHGPEIQAGKAYNDTDIGELRQIWPGMDKRQVSSMHDFFRTARDVRSSYTLLEEPKINGSAATVKITQDTTFVVEGRQQKQSGTLTLKLKPTSGTPEGWRIDSTYGEYLSVTSGGEHRAAKRDNVARDKRPAVESAINPVPCRVSRT